MFSNQLKEELIKNNECSNEDYLSLLHSIIFSLSYKIDDKIIVELDNSFVHRFFLKILKRNIKEYEIIKNKHDRLLNIFVIKNYDFDIKKLNEKIFLKGVFLAHGYVHDPNKMYMLEIIFNSKNKLDFVRKILLKYHVESKVTTKKKYEVLYIKDGEILSNFLVLIGANTSFFKYEDIRVKKSVKNNVNRITNCEKSNLSKIANSAYKHKKYIDIIEKKIGLENLDDNIREVAILRREYISESLEEIGAMLNPPLSKSGVYHRLKKIEKIAKEL